VNLARVFELSAWLTPRLELIKPMRVSVCAYEAGFGVIHETLPVTGFGDTLELATADFCDTFEHQFEHLVMCDVSELTDGAVRARDELASYAVRTSAWAQTSGDET
jgi:hypothetical protein